MGLEGWKNGHPFVTFGKRTTYVFNTVSAKEYGLYDYEGVRFTVLAKESIVKFDFIDEMEPIFRNIGFTKLSSRTRTNAIASGGARIVKELYPILRPHEERDEFIIYRCPLYEHKDSKADSVVIYCDLNKSEEHSIMNR